MPDTVGKVMVRVLSLTMLQCKVSGDSFSSILVIMPFVGRFINSVILKNPVRLSNAEEDSEFDETGSSLPDKDGILLNDWIDDEEADRLLHLYSKKKIDEI